MPWSSNKFTTYWASYQGFRSIVGNSHFHFSSVVILQAYISHKSLDISSSKQAIAPFSLQVFPEEWRCMSHKTLHFEFYQHPSLAIYTILHINSQKHFSTQSTNHLHKILDFKATFFFSLQNLHASTWAFVHVAYKFHTLFPEISHFLRVALTFQEKNTLFPLFCLVHIAKYPTFAKVNSNKNNKITEISLTLSYFTAYE